MQSLIQLAGLNFAAVIAMMIIGWLISLWYRNVSVVDSLWGFGFVLIVWITFFLADGFIGRRALIAILVTVWGMRLSIYLGWRNWGAGEDRRYGRWRKESGGRFWFVSLFKVFLLQAVFLWTISIVLQYGQFAPTPGRFSGLDILGMSVWAIGFFLEVVADGQLTRFKAKPDNEGKVMDRGLWAYSRHPNYFGEFLIWWGFFLMTLSTDNSWWTVVSPLVITAVLLKMTGIPLTERSIVDHRPAYREYIERTRAFFPWFPKKENR